MATDLPAGPARTDRSDGSTPSLPHPAGLPAAITMRPYAGAADHPGMTDANNAWREAAGFIDFVTVAGMDVQYANIPRFEPAADCVVLEQAGAIVGYARVESADARDGERLYSAVVIAPPGPVRHGYEMIRPDLEAIPDAPLPDGLEIRPVLPEHLRAIYEAEDEAFRDHWGALGEAGDGWGHFSEDPRNDLSLWRVAWDGDEVAGMVRSYIDPATNARTGRLTGWTEHISVRRRWRRRGLARALLAESLRAVRDRGMTDASLGVDAGNETGALRLYESMGFVVAQDHITYHRPLDGAVTEARS